MGLSIQTATLEQAMEITQLHVRVWRDTYRGMAPDEAIEKLTVEHRLPIWLNHLSKGDPRQHVRVVENVGEIIGFASCGPPSHPDFEDSSEVKHLYVAPEFRGRHLGERLLLDSFQRMASDGFDSTALAVVRENKNALGFYAKMGVLLLVALLIQGQYGSRIM